MKYNIYKLHNDKYTQFLNDIVYRNYDELDVKEIDNVIYEGYILKKESDEKIEWTKVILPFFDEEPLPKNNSVSFIVIITQETGRYVLTYGSAHFLVSKYLDEDFPYELISRIKMKNIKNLALNNHKKNNNRSIQTYTRYPHLIVDIGSSVAKISATPENDYFGKRVEAAKSFKLNINGGLSKVSEYINTFEDIIVNQDPIENIPTIKKIHDKELIKELYEKLATNIDDLMFEGGVEEFEIIGTYYNFTETYDRYQLKFGNVRKDLPDMDLREILRILKENNYEIKSFEDLKQVKVKFFNDNDNSYLKSIHNYINYVVDNSYHLIEGNWYQFNNFYIDYLNNFFDELPIEYDPEFDFDNERFKQEKPQVALKNSDQYRDAQKEEYFNIKASEKTGYINMDRDLIILDRYKVEICDLYNESDSEIIAVKMGSTQKMAYVVDQINTAIESVKNNKLDTIPEEMRNFSKATLWLVLDRRNHINALGDLNSLILKLKLVDFYNKCRHYGITPSVKINYIK